MSTRQQRQDTRKKILNLINARINATHNAYDGLFEIADRCAYIVEIVTPKLIQVTVVSAKSLPNGSRSVLCNKELYSQRKYWGRIEKTGKSSEKKWEFKRETRIKESLTVGSTSTLFSFNITDLDRKIAMQDMVDAFSDYRQGV